MDNKTFTHLLSFWRDFQIFSPQEIPQKKSDTDQEFIRDWTLDTVSPWRDNEFKKHPIISSKAWQHCIYAVTYERTHYISCLAEYLGVNSPVFEERLTGDSCVFFLAFDEHGQPLVETLMINMAAWAFGILQTQGINALTSHLACDKAGLHVSVNRLEVALSDSGLPGFDLQLDRLREELAWRIAHLSPAQIIDRTWINDFAQLILDKCKITNLVSNNFLHRIKSVQIPRLPKTKNGIKARYNDDYVNYIAIKELNYLINQGWSRTGKSLRHLLEPPADLLKTDLRTQKTKALFSLKPDNFPQACWPSTMPLLWSQQIAVNAMWKELHFIGGTFAIQSPHGTEKIQVMRDMIAAVVTGRAKVLATYGENLFDDKRIIEIREQPTAYYPLAQMLSGFSIVIASDNPDELENILLKLSQQNAIQDNYESDTGLYKELASELLGKPAWGTIAAKLDNKENCSQFVTQFWSQRDKKYQQNSGLCEKLSLIRQGKLSPALPWKEAVEKFNHAITEEQTWRRRFNKLYLIPDTILSLKNGHLEATNEHLNTTTRQTNIQRQLNSLVARIAYAVHSIDRTKIQIRQHKEFKPGVLEWVLILGKSHRLWRRKQNALKEQLRQTEQIEANLQKQINSIKKTIIKIDQQIAGLEMKVQEFVTRIESAEAELVETKNALGSFWPDLTKPEEEQELSSPWAYHKWRQARSRVFITALNLHRAFIEENAQKMMANLNIAMHVLNGEVQDSKIRALAFDNLTMVCPVVLTRFNTLSNLMGESLPGSIGWLLIEEGMATTLPVVAGTMARALHAITFGDSLLPQLSRILPAGIESVVADHYKDIPLHWRPSQSSVQFLANRVTSTGTAIEIQGKKLWTGPLLRIHSGCDEPMFSVLNTLAYNNLLIHQQKLSSVLWPASAWLQVPATSDSNLWQPAEGAALIILLNELFHKHQLEASDISLLSPFREVVSELQKIGESHRLNPRFIRTTDRPGKETSIIILVLGGGTSAAREWVASYPYLLYNAISRAKNRLYVIGDYKAWTVHAAFERLAAALVQR